MLYDEQSAGTHGSGSGSGQEPATYLVDLEPSALIDVQESAPG